MALLISSINSETKELIENNVRLLSIGNHNALPKNVRNKLFQAIDQTKNNTGLTLVLALSYSARWELTEAAKKIAGLVVDHKISVDDIDEKIISDNLTTTNIPDPELMIRTSGEYRISNFLLWQLAYSELYFTDKLWPEFGKEEFFKALMNYQSRERRFGKTSEQLEHNI